MTIRLNLPLYYTACIAMREASAAWLFIIRRCAVRVRSSSIVRCLCFTYDWHAHICLHVVAVTVSVKSSSLRSLCRQGSLVVIDVLQYLFMEVPPITAPRTLMLVAETRNADLRLGVVWLRRTSRQPTIALRTAGDWTHLRVLRRHTILLSPTETHCLPMLRMPVSLNYVLGTS